MVATKAAAPKPSLVPSKVVRVVFIALVCDLLAFTMPLPLFPRLIGDFVEKESAQNYTSPTLLSYTLTFVRSLRRTLFSYSSLAPLSEVANSRWDLTLLGGLLGSLFSFCQFLVSPYLGGLSDKYGRRPVLLLSMLGNLLSGALWLFASSFGLYAASRVVGGLSEGNVQLSIAVISDVTSPATRSRALALVGAAFSLAFTVGPSLGAYFASRTIGKGENVEVAGFKIKLNSYAVPAAASLVLLTLETVYLAVCLPETRWYKQIAGDGDEQEKEKAPVVVRSLEERKTRLKALEWLHLSFLFFFSGAEFTLTFLTYNLFSYTNSENGKLLGFIGILSSLLQGGYTRRRSATPNGPFKLARAGMSCCTLSLLLLAILPHVGPMGGYSSTPSILLYTAGAGLAFVSATVVTSLTALASLECSSGAEGIDKGAALGRFRSRGQLGRSLGPLVATGLYWIWGPSYAYGFAAVGAATVSWRMNQLEKPARRGAAKKVKKEQ